MEKPDYLKTVGEQIRCKRAVPFVLKELEDHITDQKNAYVDMGMSEEEAVKAAVEEMGDPVETGVELDAIHRPQMPWKAIKAIGAISLFGIVLKWITGPYELSNTLYVLIGFALMIGICYADYTQIAKWSKPLVVIITVVILGMVYIVPEFLMDETRQFLFIRGIYKTADLKRILISLVPLYGVILYQYRGKGWKAILSGYAWMVFPMLCVGSMNSIHMIYMLFLCFSLCLCAAVARGWYSIPKKRTLGLIAALIVAVPLLYLGFLHASGQNLQEIRLSPVAFGEEFYQPKMLKKIIAGSRLLGDSNLGGMFKSGVWDTGSYLFTFLSCYCGILVAILVTGVLTALILRLLQKSWRQTNQLGMMMSLGCCITFLIQIADWVIANLGLLSISDAYCPFLTYGGTGTIMTFMLLGIILSVYRNKMIVWQVCAFTAQTVRK